MPPKDDLYRQQMDLIYKFRDSLIELKRKDLRYLYEYNKRDPEGLSETQVYRLLFVNLFVFRLFGLRQTNCQLTAV